MRLTAREAQAIIDSAQETLPAGSVVSLFGSRLQPDVRGGDIDLLVETPGELAADDWIQRRSRFVARIQRRLEERRIDVVQAAIGGHDERSIVRSAREQAQRLTTVH